MITPREVTGMGMLVEGRCRWLREAFQCCRDHKDVVHEQVPVDT
jgi:hypothetical protein